MRQLQSEDQARADLPEYNEILRVPAMSVGTYRLPAGSIDPQQPHTEDEIYMIVRGSGVLRAECGDAPVRTGVALFVPAGERHSFVDITEELFMYVVFAPAEHSLRAERQP